LHELGIDFEPNSKISEDTLETIAKKYDAVFIGTGIGKPRELNLPGSSLKNIMSAMKFLVNLNQSNIPMISKGEKVVVIGAGYVGIDAARSAVRLGGEVTCITQAAKEDALKGVASKDYLEAEEEGVKFVFGVRVKEFKGNEKVEKVIYENHIEGELDAAKVISAIGQEHDEDSLKAPLRTEKNGCIIVNENFQTKLPNVFAAGDCVHGPKTVIEAIAGGRRAAEAITQYLAQKTANEAMGIKPIDEKEKTTPKVDHTNKDI
jgi:NADPH-dependent glutamate synthase beta subunit-like oxidoreductase